MFFLTKLLVISLVASNVSVCVGGGWGWIMLPYITKPYVLLTE